VEESLTRAEGSWVKFYEEEEDADVDLKALYMPNGKTRKSPTGVRSLSLKHPYIKLKYLWPVEKSLHLPYPLTRDISSDQLSSAKTPNTERMIRLHKVQLSFNVVSSLLSSRR
jgi:hypothetical protein